MYIICSVDYFSFLTVLKENLKIESVFILPGSKFFEYPTELFYSDNKNLLLVSKLYQHELCLKCFSWPCFTSHLLHYYI